LGQTTSREASIKYTKQVLAADPDEVRALLTNALYLEDQAVLIEGYLFYGYTRGYLHCSRSTS
jgi:hypothetical protein